MSLRGHPIEETASLPDGREAVVRVSVPEDPYIPQTELDTVTIELVIDDRVEAIVTTALDPEQESEAAQLSRTIVEGLESGGVEPTGDAIERVAFDVG